MNDILEKAKFNAEGLIPAIVQDVHTREILMLAYMNEEALRLTLQRRETYFWSRSRQSTTKTHRTGLRRWMVSFSRKRKFNQQYPY